MVVHRKEMFPTLHYNDREMYRTYTRNYLKFVGLVNIYLLMRTTVVQLCPYVLV